MLVWTTTILSQEIILCLIIKDITAIFAFKCSQENVLNILNSIILRYIFTRVRSISPPANEDISVVPSSILLGMVSFIMSNGTFGTN